MADSYCENHVGLARNFHESKKKRQDVAEDGLPLLLYVLYCFCCSG